jgi:hypothetical protein
MDTARTVTFHFQPSAAPVALPAPGPAAGASVAITAPETGATVGPQFKLEVKTTNFTASCDLEGKPNVAGYGHFHVFVDQDPAAMMAMMSGDHSNMPMSGDHANMPMTGEHGDMGGMDMMEMPGMIAMPCAGSIPVDLSAWPSGQHTLSVELDQNDHTPLMDPGAMAPKFQTITIVLKNPFRP